MSRIPSTAPIDLTNCEREPIHIPGQIQAHGLLLAFRCTTRTIVHASDNVGEFLGTDAAALIGAPVSAVLDAAGLLAIEPLWTRAEQAPVHVPVGALAGKQTFDVIVHRSGPLLILEAERAADPSAGAPDFYAFASRTLASLRIAATRREYCALLAAAIRDLTGYDRVMIYRFAEDWSGEVFAESMAADQGLHPFLGLHYPASDIPAQARELFLKNAVRMLPDAGYQPARIVPELDPDTGTPLDLSHAFLRGASQMYTEYLTNMGVRASLTLALTQRDVLWGLVACHHYSPRQISHGHRVACELLARVASLQISDRARSDEDVYRERTARMHSAIVEALAKNDGFGSALVQATQEVQQFVDCTGVAIVSRGQIVTVGAVPPKEHIERLTGLLATSAQGRVFSTTRLAEVYKDAGAIVDVAAGALVLPLATTAGELVIWFRPERVRTVSWAGDPHKPVTVGPMGDRLTPRKSFALWTETMQGTCQPWTRMEREAAEQLRTSFVELQARQHTALEQLNRELSRSNAELDSFAYTASHDLKEPLRGMYNHASFLLGDAQARLIPADVSRVESIIRLATRTHTLIDTLLEFSRLGRSEPQRELVAVTPLVRAAVDQLSARMSERRVHLILCEDMPTIWCAPHLMTQIFANLLSNALKYNAAEVAEVEVGFASAGDANFPAEALGFLHAYYVKDNGIGILERHREVVFQIFKRLHAADKFGGGTGAGLTIVKKAAERLGGKVWIAAPQGPGTVVWFVVSENEPVAAR